MAESNTTLVHKNILGMYILAQRSHPPELGRFYLLNEFVH